MRFRIALLLMLPLAAPLMVSAQPADRPKAAPNPPANRYATLQGAFRLPPGRTMGSSSAVAGDSKGHVWVVDRCGANDCANSKLNPVMEFDATGKLLRSWGAGLFLFPHGFFIDRNDHLWITDNHVAPKKNGSGKGETVMEFTQDGKLLRTLGKPGISGTGPDTFHEPNAVVVAQDGSIFVAEGHLPEVGSARVIKFDKTGKFIKQWGGHGRGPGQFEMPHCLALDSKGRLYVGDRDNNRIQIFTQDGRLLGQLTQFGRPSGIAIDKDDVLYVTDSESRAAPGYGHHPGWKRGIRIGSLKDGIVTDFIPDTMPNPDSNTTSGGEGIWADGKGAVWSAQVAQREVVKYEKAPR